MSDLYKQYHLNTYSGKLLDFANPKPESIDIIDIAHSLANQCRFSGHIQSFYSVAEHSCKVAEMVPQKYKLAALLHDAAEAYITDIPRPLKYFLAGKIVKLENKILKLIAEKYGFDFPIHKKVWQADDKMLEYEWQYMVKTKALNKIAYMTPDEAKMQFLIDFHKYSEISERIETKTFNNILDYENAI